MYTTFLFGFLKIKSNLIPKSKNKKRLKLSYLLILGIITTFSFGVDYAFAANVSITQGSSVPGCETTKECFIPYEVSIPVGGQVVWLNDDSAAHTVTGGSSADSPSGVFDSSLFMAETTFSYTFSEAGVYLYFCMVHPWMQGIVNVGNYSDSSHSSTEKTITVQMNGPSTFYLDVPNQIIRATVEIQNFNPSEGQYIMKITHRPTNTVLKDFEIFPKSAVNDLWTVQIAYPILESDIRVEDQVLLGEYEIHIRTEFGSQTATTTFSILESSSQSNTPRVSETEIVIDVQANKRFYDENEKIQVTGTVNKLLYGNKISLRIISPNSNIILVDQVPIESDGIFSYDLSANNSLFVENGDYTIQLIYGKEGINKNILFSYVGHASTSKPIPTPEPVVEQMPEPVVEQMPEPTKENEETDFSDQQVVSQGEESGELSNILLYLGMVIAVSVVIAVVMKLKNSEKDDELTENYDYEDDSIIEEEPLTKKLQDTEVTPQLTPTNSIQIDQIIKDKIQKITKLQENQLGDHDRLENFKKSLKETGTFSKVDNEYFEKIYETYKKIKKIDSDNKNE